MNLLKSLSFGVLFGLSTAASAYYTQQSSLYSEDGKRVIINGVSWSGFQDTNVFQGLQNNPFYAMQKTQSNPREYGMMDLLSHPADFVKSGVHFSLYKTVRLPIQPNVLYDDQGEVDLNKSISDKNNPMAGNGIFCKTWQSNGQFCDKAVSPKQAFWIVLTEMKKNNINVLIDMHHRSGYGDGMRDGTVYDMQQYKKDMSLLASQIKQRGLDNVIGVDIFNEPYRLNWFQSSEGQDPWTKVIATAANAIYEANPNLLLFVEGPDGGSNDQDTPVICVPKSDITDDPNGYAHAADPGLCSQLDRLYFKGNWGEDFKPLLNALKAKQGVAELDKNKFVTELKKQGITSDVLDWLLGDMAANNGHIVFSPHVYPAEVAGWETASGNPSRLRFDWTWGFLQKANYPVVLGEASWKSAQGKAFFTDALMPYLKENGETNHVFFWAIGYLGDTVTAMDPNTGALNLDVYQTLEPYFERF